MTQENVYIQKEFRVRMTQHHEAADQVGCMRSLDYCRSTVHLI